MNLRSDGRPARQIGVGERSYSNLVACGRRGHDHGGRSTHYNIRGKHRARRLYFSDAGRRGGGRAAHQIGVGERSYSNLVACGRRGHDLGGRRAHHVRGKRGVRGLYFGDAGRRGYGRASPPGGPFDPPFIPNMRAGNDDPLGIVVRMARIRDDVRLQLLDDGRMIVDEHGMSGVIHEASEFARHGIAGKQDTGLQRLHLKPALALVFI